MVINLVEHMRIFRPCGISQFKWILGLIEVSEEKYYRRRTCQNLQGKPAGVKGSESRFASVMKFGRYVTVDDGGNHVTFHELNQRLRKDKKITKAQSDSVSNREF